MTARSNSRPPKASTRPSPSQTPGLVIIGSNQHPPSSRKSRVPIPSKRPPAKPVILQPEDSDDDYDDIPSPKTPRSPHRSIKSRPNEDYSYNYEELSAIPTPEISFVSVVSGVCSEVSDSISAVFGQLRDWQKHFLQTIGPIEQSQQLQWYSSIDKLLRQQNGTFPLKLSYGSDLIAKARAVLSPHRFAFPGGVSHFCRVAVIGPLKSGRSAFLTILAEQFLVDLLASGDWKRTLIFVMDLALISHLFTDPGALFQAIVQLSFQSLAAQLPLLLPHLNGLTAAFTSIVTSRTVLPKSLTNSDDFRAVVPALRDVHEAFAASWADHSSLEPFIANMFRLPILLGEIFGYQKCVYVVDHVDLADVTLAQPLHFAASEENVFLLEQLKFALDSVSFFVSSRRENAISELFPAFTVGTVDLTRSLECVPTLDIVKEESDAVFQVSFQNEEPQFALRIQHFGGCPAFLVFWAELNRLADGVDRAVQSGGDVDESRLFLNTEVEKVFGRLFLENQGEEREQPEIAVKSTTRFSKPQK